MIFTFTTKSDPNAQTHLLEYFFRRHCVHSLKLRLKLSLFKKKKKDKSSEVNESDNEETKRKRGSKEKKDRWRIIEGEREIVTPESAYYALRHGILSSA